MTNQTENEIEGVYVANVTPFKENFDIDIEAYLAHMSWLAEKGVHGVVPLGTNGEGPLVGFNEKMRLFEAIFARSWTFHVIPTLTQGNLAETLELIRLLNDMPAKAVMVLPPYYFRPAADEGLKRFFDAVVSASRHPLIVYHIPKYAVPINADLVEALPVWGVKNSSGDDDYTKAVLAAGKGVLLGTEDDLWRRLSLGAPGMISALANVIPERMVELYELFRRGDASNGKPLAAMLQDVRAMTKEYTASALLKKLAEARHGVPLGTVRPPLVPAPDDYDPRPVLGRAGVPS